MKMAGWLRLKPKTLESSYEHPTCPSWHHHNLGWSGLPVNEMKGYDSNWFANYQARNNRPGGSGVVQKHQDGNNQTAPTPDNKPSKKKTNGPHNQSFRVNVTFLVADNRDRDADGMYSTVQDCLIDAVGRLLKMDRKALRRLAKSIERTGRI